MEIAVNILCEKSYFVDGLKESFERMQIYEIDGAIILETTLAKVVNGTVALSTSRMGFGLEEEAFKYAEDLGFEVEYEKEDDDWAGYD